MCIPQNKMKYKKSVLLLILIFLVGFSYSVSATELIYQEDADSHWCETGPFEENFTEYCYNMTDGDWDTGIHLWIENPDTPGHPLITEMDLYLEYEKPEGALSFSYWTLKSGAHLDYGNPAEFNLSFEDFPGCWDQETLELKAYIFSWFGHGGETTFFYCHDGNDWVNMNEDWGPLGSDANFYEDAMVWVVETPEASVNWSGVDLFGGGGLTTCPAGEGSEYSSLKVFVRDQNNESIEGIPAADFDFIVSDTFVQFADPLMAKLGRPTLFCNSLLIGPDGSIAGYNLRQNDGKRKAALSLKSLNYDVIAVGDSYNDITMLQEADKGILFNPPENVKNEYPEFQVSCSYEELKNLIQETIVNNFK